MFLLKLIAVATLGLAFAFLLKSKSQSEKAKKANVKYSMIGFLIEDKGTIITTYIVLALSLMVFGPLLDPSVILTKDKEVTFFFDLFTIKVSAVYEIFLMSVFATVGYSGMDIALRFFGKTNSLINNAIDYKTTQADAANGTLNEPTPVK